MLGKTEEMQQINIQNIASQMRVAIFHCYLCFAIFMQHVLRIVLLTSVNPNHCTDDSFLFSSFSRANSFQLDLHMYKLLKSLVDHHNYLIAF